MSKIKYFEFLKNILYLSDTVTVPGDILEPNRNRLTSHFRYPELNRNRGSGSG